MEARVTAGRVTGIGGVFLRARDPETLGAWYRERLGLDVQTWGETRGTTFAWRELGVERRGHTVWSLFPTETAYLGAGDCMINYRVEDLDAVLAALRAEGVKVDDRVEASEFGRFGWVTDPEGNRIELWQPPAAMPGDA